MLNLNFNKKNIKNWIWAIIRSIILIGFCVIILTPVLEMITRSFMEPQDLYDASIVWIPKNFTLDNIKIAFEAISFGTSFLNSIWFTLLLIVLQLVPCLMAGYGFAKYDFRFKNILFAGVILTLIVPPQLTMVASYMDFHSFDFLGIGKLFGFNGINLLNTITPQALMAITGVYFRNGLFIYMLRQAFIAVPKATEEAAVVDGAGHFRTFFQIMLPAVKTTLTTVILFAFVWQWNDCYYAGLYNPSFKILTNMVTTTDYPSFITGYSSFAGFSAYNTLITSNLFSTAALLMLIFPIVMFLCLQKQFVESIERSGMVG